MKRLPPSFAGPVLTGPKEAGPYILSGKPDAGFIAVVAYYNLLPKNSCAFPISFFAHLFLTFLYYEDKASP